MLNKLLYFIAAAIEPVVWAVGLATFAWTLCGFYAVCVPH